MKARSGSVSVLEQVINKFLCILNLSNSSGSWVCLALFEIFVAVEYPMCLTQKLRYFHVSVVSCHERRAHHILAIVLPGGRLCCTACPPSGPTPPAEVLVVDVSLTLSSNDSPLKEGAPLPRNIPFPQMLHLGISEFSVTKALLASTGMTPEGIPAPELLIG